MTEPRALEIVRGDAVSSTRPLRRKIAEYLNDDVFAKIAAEGRKGRSLLVGTTNLDAGRSVVWDITRLAASDAPNAPALIHDVILASASIPGVFPPVLIEVEADGQRYDELYVDGGVTAQLFFSPAGADWRRIAERLDARGQPRLYVIRNASWPRACARRPSVADDQRARLTPPFDTAQAPRGAWERFINKQVANRLRH